MNPSYRAHRARAASARVWAVLAAALTAGASLAAASPAVARVTSHASSAAAMPRAAVPAYGAIEGVVRGPGGIALGRVCVAASGRAGSVAALTGPGGRYLLAGLPAGAYLVQYRDCSPARRPGGLRFLGEAYGAGMPGSPGRPVLVRAGMPVRLAPVTLLPAGGAAMRAAMRAAGLRAAAAVAAAPSGPTISGVVRNTAGAGLPGMCVSAFRITADTLEGVGTQAGRGGRYTLPVRRGNWQVSFGNGCGTKYAPQWWKHATSQARATLVRVRAGGHVTGIDASLVVGGAITGTVRGSSASGPKLGGVCVVATGTGQVSGVGQVAVTRGDGTYRVTGLGTGRYRLQFDPQCGNTGSYLASSHAGAVSVADGKTTSGVNGVLPPAAQISGTVTAASGGAPLAGICLFADPQSGGLGVSSGAGAGFGQTGADGTYTITGLAAGTYTVTFSGGCGGTGSYAPQAYNGRQSGFAADPVSLATGQHVTGIDAAMQPGGTITGTVTNFTNAKLPHVCVFATAEPDAGPLGATPLGLLLAGAPLFTVAQTGKAGGYRIANLAPGRYSVSFSSGCGRTTTWYAAQWFAPQGGNKPDWISVPGGAPTSGIGARLKLAAAIAGVLTNRAGKPVQGMCPVAVPLTGQPLTGGLGEFVGPPGASDRSGRYLLTGLAAGRYAVGFSPCHGQPYALSWYASQGPEVSARPVAVTDGHVVRGINSTVPVGQPVSGTIRSAATGKPVARACVVALDRGGFLAGEAITGPRGGYVMRRLTAGTYTFGAFPCGGTSALAGVTRPGVVVTWRKPVSGAGITLPAAGSMTGTVLGGSPAAPAAGICVLATPQTGRGLPGVGYTGAGGAYTMTGLAPGRYLVRFSSLCPGGSGGFAAQWFSGAQSQAQATPVFVASGATRSGVGATLAADGAVAGTVQVSGVPAAGVCAVAYPAGGGAPAVAETKANGSYQIGGLEPGSYLVEFTSGCGAESYATQWYAGAPARSAATPVTVTAGTFTSGIDAS